jgi:hypothetical protein
MDVNDFVRAAEIDKVLVKILLLRPKKKINHLLRRMATEQAARSGESNSAPSASTFVASMSPAGMKEELQSALQQANLTNAMPRERTVSGSNAFPIANSIGRFARGLYEGVTAPANGVAPGTPGGSVPPVGSASASPANY